MLRNEDCTMWSVNVVAETLWELTSVGFQLVWAKLAFYKYDILPETWLVVLTGSAMSKCTKPNFLKKQCSSSSYIGPKWPWSTPHASSVTKFGQKLRIHF